MIVEFCKNRVLTLLPFVKSRREKPRYSPDGLLAGMTSDNVPQEVACGPPRGNEVWYFAALSIPSCHIPLRRVRRSLPVARA